MRPSQANPKTQIFCTKTYIKKPNIRKSASQEAKVHLKACIYISRDQSYENTQRVTGLSIRKHKYQYSVRKGILTRSSVPKCTNILKYMRKSISQEAICAKACSASQACSKTQTHYTKTYNHDALSTKTYKHFVVYPSNCHVVIILCDVGGGAPLA